LIKVASEESLEDSADSIKMWAINLGNIDFTTPTNLQETDIEKAFSEYYCLDINSLGFKFFPSYKSWK
jgi:hypothetical protein